MFLKPIERLDCVHFLKRRLIDFAEFRLTKILKSFFNVAVGRNSRFRGLVYCNLVCLCKMDFWFLCSVSVVASFYFDFVTINLSVELDTGRETFAKVVFESSYGIYLGFLVSA
ncbi:hypothetical protein [uncultured Roseibium sp.]|uniref:hypothetical protein n=1 Tax=uncultured Roseibium sp. TaxID=1936171 RepID=UPI0026241E8C|nr:hypothetical protein [uncultured Roseibium sp.]